MNRDARTQPLLTEPLPSASSLRDSTRVTEAVPAGVLPDGQPAATEPALTQAYPSKGYLTELAVTQPLFNATVMAEPAVAETLVADRAIDSLFAQPTLAETPLAETMVADSIPDQSQPVQPESAQERPPTDSEPLRQIDRLTALVEQELRKSNPAYSRAPATPELPPSAEEESLQSYLDRFMERVTGKKPDAPPPAPESPVPAAATPSDSAPLPAAPPEPQLNQREPVRPPECRQTLAAMRDLANENARSAVANHAGRHHWRQAQLTLLAAGAASLVSTACAVGNLVTGMPGTIEGAVCAGILAGLMSCRFFLRCRQLAAPALTP